MAIAKLAQVVQSSDYLDALRAHLNRGLLSVHPEAISEITAVRVTPSVPGDATIVHITVIVRPAFI